MHPPIKKRRLGERKIAEDVDTSGSGSLIAHTGTNSGGSGSLIAHTGTNSGGSKNGASGSSTAPIENRYEVFLSFRGPDSRKRFTDHLYNGLVNAGIRVFRDNVDLPHGEEIGSNLWAAIKNSKIMIPILSVNYGKSSWCLDELVQIMECKNNNTAQVVLPIFYEVEPAHMRYLIGSFGKAFLKRERRLRKRGFDPTILEKWKQALIEVSYLKGLNADGFEGELVKSVVRKVLIELKKEFDLVITDNFVGIDSHVEKVMNFIDNNSPGTLFVGIHGMGGIGKTTLAKIIYNKLSNQFDHRSFIADIRESCKRDGLVCLQNKLISDILKQTDQISNEDEGTKIISSMFESKKVLILLDDVDDDDQLKALAGNHSWFSSGSRIIITSRNISILENAGVNYNHKHEKMDDNQSLTLFSRHAFRRDSPPSEFEDLAREVVSTTGGLPLALQVVGSSLCGKKKNIWRGTIKKLRKVPHKKVRKKLMISYEELEDEQKEIFLDIACFFIGTDERIASYMWDACDFFPEEGIEELRLRSLITIGDHCELRMHDQLRDLGREIVCKENKKEPHYRSRLWDSNEVLEMLKEDKGTEKIEAIYLSRHGSKGFGKTINLMGKQFKKLRTLRFLGTSGAHFTGDFEDSFKKLKWLQWWNCPSTFEANNFHLKELVVLDMSQSEISDEWQGWSFILMAKKLKYLDLTYCQSLAKTSFLSAFENLEVLILACCERIEQIDSSIGNMKSLVRMDLTGCGGLKELPEEVGKLAALEQLLLESCDHISSLPDKIGNMKSLVRLDLSSCERLEGLPVEVGKLEALEQLDLGFSGIKELPDSIGALHKLKFLNIGGSGIKELPDSIGDLQNLEILNIYSSGIKELPDSIGDLKKLKLLDISGTEIEELPDSIGDLQNLEILDISETEIEELPDSIGDLQNLEILNISATWIKELPNGIGRLRKLRDLDASSCRELGGEMPESIRNLSSLQHLKLFNCQNIQLPSVLPSNLTTLFVAHQNCISPSLSNLTRLKKLRLLSGQFRELIWKHPSTLLEKSLNTPFELEILEIISCDLMETLDISQLNHLRILFVSSCRDLPEIRGLDKLKYLESLRIDRCNSIKRLDLSYSKGLKGLRVDDCENLVEIQGLNKLEFLTKLNIFSCTSIKRLDLSKFEGLKEFTAHYCKNLVEIEGLDKLQSLEVIGISNCTSIQRLDLLKSKGIKILDARYCKSLVEIQGLDGLEFLKVLKLSGCTSFGRLPDLCCFDTLRTLAINCRENLHDIQSLERFPSCTSLWIEDYKSSAKFPNLSIFCNLRILILSNCHELQEIPGLEESTSLKCIAISGCSSIEILPDLSSCTNLISLAVQNCEKLTEVRGLEKLGQKVELDISGCKSLKTIPELFGTQIYQNESSRGLHVAMREFGY